MGKKSGQRFKLAALDEREREMICWSERTRKNKKLDGKMKVRHLVTSVTPS